MKAQRTFSEALTCLDGGSLTRGEAMLRKAISTAEHEDNEFVLGSALFRLGELLIKEHRTLEARPILARIIEIDSEDNPLFFEADRARELLGFEPSLSF